MVIDYQGLVPHGLEKLISKKIREAILESQVPVHELLAAGEEHGARFSLSQRTIREALERLAARHRIRSRRGAAGGTFVNRPTQEAAHLLVADAAALFVTMAEFTLENSIGACREMELVCWRLATERRTDGAPGALASEIDRQRGPSITDSEFDASDARFHRILIDASKDAALGFAAAGVIALLQTAFNLIVFYFRDRTPLAGQHARLLRALVARNDDGYCGALTGYRGPLRKPYRKARSARLSAAEPVARQSARA